MVAFEIARRHRFTEEMGALPDGVEVVVLPAGDGRVPGANLRYRSAGPVAARIRSAYEASAAVLDR